MASPGTHLRNAWYMAAWSHEVGDALFGRRLLQKLIQKEATTS